MDEIDIGGLLVGLGLIGFVIYIIVKFVIPFLLAASAIVLVVAAAIGAIIGIVMAIKNFVAAIAEVLDDRKYLRGYKNSELHDSHNRSMNADPTCYYENYASKSYLFGPCFRDVFYIILTAIALNFDDLPEFGRGEVWFTKVIFFVLTLVQIIVTCVLGTAFSIVLSLVLLVIFIVFWLIACIISGIVLLFEHIYFVRKQISYRCPSCKGEYNLPVYQCPECGIRHKRLKPGAYGIRKRKCLCSTVLPLTAKGKGYMLKLDSAASVRRIPVKLEEMNSYCPNCNTQHNAGLSKPTSIALIGGASAGKTTFKVAFLHDLFEEELVKMGIDYSFPDDALEQEYSEINQYYTGRRIIPATSRGFENDISTFSFSLSNKKFSASRMIHIYDMPGEVFESGDAKEGWDNYSFTEGAVFLLDPYSIPSVKVQNQKVVDESSMGICTMQMNNLAESLINTLDQVKVPKHKGRFTIPIALAINKVDSQYLKGLCGGDAVASLMKEKPDVFDDYFVTVDYVCRSFLSRNGGDNFIATLDQHFETVHYFFSSPMGYIPKASRTRFSPVNVIPIMQWMMLRADKQLGKVWKPEWPVEDITNEQKQLYIQHPEYYDEFVLGVFSATNTN